MTINQTEHPIRLFLHGFTKPINNRMGAICSYPENPAHKLVLQGEEQGMLLLLNNWVVAGKPESCLWLPRSELLSLGYSS